MKFNTKRKIVHKNRKGMVVITSQIKKILHLKTL